MMMSSALQAPPQLTPLERRGAEELVRHLRSDPRVERLVVFGSRARARSGIASDLDIAVYLSGERERPTERWVEEQRQAVEARTEGLRLNLVPLFAGEPPTTLTAAINRDGITLWKSN